MGHSTRWGYSGRGVEARLGWRGIWDGRSIPDGAWLSDTDLVARNEITATGV